MNAIMMEKTNISGLLIAVLMIIIKPICTLATSVVILVTRDADENLSMFSKENPCILSKILPLRFFEKPEAAFAEVYPAVAPKVRERQAIKKRRTPLFKISERATPLFRLSTI
jgi:hypothetical protein